MNKEEDNYGSYADVLVKYFLAEGAVCTHALCLASSDNQPEMMLEVRKRIELNKPDSLTFV